MPGRKKGSNILVILIGVALIILAAFILFHGAPKLKDSTAGKLVDAGKTETGE
jgi:hypothetical protein